MILNRRLVACFAPTLTLFISLPVFANTFSHQQLRTIAESACADFAITPANELEATITRGIAELLGDELQVEQEDIEFRGRVLGTRLLFRSPLVQAMNIQLITPPNQPRRTVLTSFRTDAKTKPELQLMLGADCTTQLAQQLVYDQDNSATHIQQLSLNTLSANGLPEWVNPPVPRLTPLQPPRIRVGMVDSGVNYQLPGIANALARNSAGKLIGYDFWDMDEQPFDAHPAQSPFRVQRHGTRTASIVINEAPGVAIVPYRYPRPDMSRMTDLIKHASDNDVRIIGMPLGSNRFSDWGAFQKAAEKHPEILFIASAGNNGRDIDQRGVYPASLDIDNMLVVTSADDFAKPAERTNYGRIAVDYMLPAERIAALDYDGSEHQVSGSSYAVSRLVALAARILNRMPALTTDELRKEIEVYAVKARTSRYVSTGYIGDPLATPAALKTTEEPIPPSLPTTGQHTLPLDIIVLSDKWVSSNITHALQEASGIFSQCDINIAVDQWLSVQAPDYLQDLSTGNAMTLARKVPTDNVTVVFAKDTIMQTPFDAEAFGEGNTANRPWMRNSLWISSVTRDTGIALAHELFHIITNNGNHTDITGNLMRESTEPDNTLLSARQCMDAITYATQAQLLQ